MISTTRLWSNGSLPDLPLLTQSFGWTKEKHELRVPGKWQMGLFPRARQVEFTYILKDCLIKETSSAREVDIEKKR